MIAPEDSPILLMAYGSPSDVADLPAYITHVRGGRELTGPALENVVARYRRIGGRSPLEEVTLAQAEALQALSGRTVYVGMLHWEPWISDTVARMLDDGITECTAIAMAPHYSMMSVGKYMKAVDAASEGRLQVKFVKSWWDQPELIALHKERITAALAQIDGPATILFTAHSLPKMRDPYEEELQGQAQMIADQLPGVDWTLTYQSAPHGRDDWLKPTLEDAIRAAAGTYKGVTVVAIGYVADHVEILYDLDIEAKEFAEELGLQFVRTESMNAHPGFIRALAAALDYRNE